MKEGQTGVACFNNQTFLIGLARCSILRHLTTSVFNVLHEQAIRMKVERRRREKLQFIGFEECFFVFNRQFEGPFIVSKRAEN